MTNSSIHIPSSGCHGYALHSLFAMAAMGVRYEYWRSSSTSASNVSSITNTR